MTEFEPNTHRVCRLTKRPLTDGDFISCENLELALEEQNHTVNY